MEQTTRVRTGILGRLWHWIDGRYSLTELSHALLEVPIPRTANTYYLGGITMFMFGVQVVTGILLAVYYQPAPERAYESILLIMNDVRFGWLIRSIHAWGANLMIIFCILHLLRVYIQGAYKAPREMTWVVGMILLLVTMGFGFTGYLLPWDQRAYWATVVGSEIAGAVPGVGEFALQFLRGGEDISSLTLSRFFATHVLILPLSLGALLFIHILMIHQQGLADPVEVESPPSLPNGRGAGKDLTHDGADQKSKWLPFYPNYVLDEVIAWYVVLGIIVVLASLLPAGLEEAADPFKTPPHVKPEWYFLAVYQALKLVPRTIGVLLPIVGIALLTILPFIDRNPHKAWRYRPIGIGLTFVIVVVMIVLSFWGQYSGG